MFNPTNQDAVCVQVSYLESRSKNVHQETSKKMSKYGDEGKGKFKGIGKKNVIVNF